MAEVFSSFVFKHPAPVILAGPTGCGKTVFIQNVLEQQLIQPMPEKIYFCYSAWQPTYDKLMLSKHLNIQFNKGMLDANCLDSFTPKLIILDDMMSEIKDSDEVGNIFTKYSHHKNISVFLVIQNLFVKGASTREMSLNTHYIVVFNNPRDRAQIGYLGREMFPQKRNFIVDAYTDACSQPFGYLILDFKQTTPERMRVLTGVLNKEKKIVYVYVHHVAANNNNHNHLSNKKQKIK